MEKNSKIYVAGHRGLAGTAFVRALRDKGYTNLVLRTHKELELTDAEETSKFFAREKPNYVILAAAKVGGIHANNTYPADFIYRNLQIQNNIIHHSYLNGVKKLLFLGSSCMYPRECRQPLKEEYLLTGHFEPTNAPYAAAKIAGLFMCESYNRQYGTKFISVILANLYGPNDRFDPQNSHVLPALLLKFHEAKKQNKKEVLLWGTGSATRDFMHVDDLVEACLLLMNLEHMPPLLNIGSGTGVSIKELAETIKEVVGFDGAIVWDASRPDGMPKRFLDTSRLRQLGWAGNKITLKNGIKDTYDWYKRNQAMSR